MLSLNLSSAEAKCLESITIRSVHEAIVGRVEIDYATNIATDFVGSGSNSATMSGVNREIISTPTSFYVAMLPYAYADGDIAIDLEFVDGTQTLLLPAVTLQSGMVLDVDCSL